MNNINETQTRMLYVFNRNKKTNDELWSSFYGCTELGTLHRRLPLRVHRPRWPTMRGGIKDGMHKTEHRKYVRKGNTSINWLNPQLLLVHEWPNSPTVVHWPTRICDRFGMLFLELTGQPRSLLTKNLWSPFHGWYKKRLIARKQARKLLMLTLSSSFWLVPISYTLHSCWLHIHVFKYIDISWFIIRTFNVTIPPYHTDPAEQGLGRIPNPPAQQPTRVKCLCTGIPQRLQCITLAVPWPFFRCPNLCHQKRLAG